jgi:hypothetical protein
MPVQLLWGCDPGRQFEAAWVRHLLGPVLQQECEIWQPRGTWPQKLQGSIPLLVESGLLHLERRPDPARLEAQAVCRRERIAHLVRQGPFGVIHLSDEEGLDGDGWYPELPPCTPIWRNFPHPRLGVNPWVRSFPIGPRDLFLAPDSELLSATERTYPWAFMGTLWPSGSRQLAVSLFLRGLPAGFYFGGRSFGQGLSLPHYRATLLTSVFALAPEGDRHLDTFRLWESLSCGCIPLLVDHNTTADQLLMAPHPVPVFRNWPAALTFAQRQLADPVALNRLQSRVRDWWNRHQLAIAHAIGDSLVAQAQREEVQQWLPAAELPLPQHCANVGIT